MARPKAAAAKSAAAKTAGEDQQPKAAAAKSAAVPDGFLPVLYVGCRAPHSDGLYGTYTTWEQAGTVQLVPEDIARKMVAINHDVYRPGEYSGQPAPEPVATKPAEDTERQELDMTIQTMGKEALEQYARTHFGQELDRRHTVESLRQSVLMMIDQYGAP